MSAKGKEAAPRFPEIPPEQVPETFTLRQGKTMLAMGVIVLVAFGGTTAWSAVSSGELQLNMLGICVLSVLAGLVILAKYRNHRLEVRGERLFYRDLFGKSWEFGVEEIVSVRRYLSENPKLMGENGRVLARCERSMENFPLLIAYLKKHHVWADMI